MTGSGPGDSGRSLSRTRRRQAGFLGLVLGCVALVELKAATAPPTHHIALGGQHASVSSGGAASGGGSSGAGASGGGASGGSPHASAGSSSPSSPSSPSGAPRTVDGQPVDIGYGIIQVQVTLQGGRITDVRTLRAPSGGRSGSIASYAIPELRREVLAAQSTSIDTVSGASYTSSGYAQSVQSALDAARA